MAWKVERWLADVFPGEAEIYTVYRELHGRELAIVAAAVLDAALAELLSMRLRDYPKDAEEFLGLNGDGRAPAGSFGARIQLALLVGIIMPEDAAILRAVKTIRNLFAHRAKLDFLHPLAIKASLELHRAFRDFTEIPVPTMSKIRLGLPELGAAIPKYAEAGEGILLAADDLPSHVSLAASDA